jgi:hypothetical protein
MKRIILFVLLFAALKVAGQTTGYLRFDTVKIMKQNGFCELYIINNTKDSLGLLTNVGGGLTQFKKPRVLNDSTFVIGNDTLVLPGAGGSSVTLSNTGTGYRWVATPGGNIKTAIYAYGVNADSTSNANAITVNADTSELVTPSDIQGMVTGNGTTNQVTYFTGPATIGGDPGITVDPVLNRLSVDSIRTMILQINTDSTRQSQILFSNEENDAGNDSVGLFGISQSVTTWAGWPRRDVVGVIGYNDPQAIFKYKPNAGTLSLHFENDYFGQHEFFLQSITHDGFSNRNFFGHFNKYSGTSDWRWSISEGMQWFRFDSSSNPYFSTSINETVAAGPNHSFSVVNKNLATGEANGSFNIAPQMDGSVSMGTGNGANTVSLGNRLNLSTTQSIMIDGTITNNNATLLYGSGSTNAASGYPDLINIAVSASGGTLWSNTNTHATGESVMKLESTSGGDQMVIFRSGSNSNDFTIGSPAADNDFRINTGLSALFGGTNLLTIKTNQRVGLGGQTSPAVGLDMNFTDAIKIASGTTAQRPTGAAGYLRYNSTDNIVEWHNGSTWVQPATGGITSINSQSGPAITVSGQGAIIINSPSANNIGIAVDVTSSSLPRTIDAITTTAQNTGTSETDLFTRTIAGGTLSTDKQTLNFEADGEFNDNTATAQLKLYFGGNATLNTGAINISTANTAWRLKGYIIRTSSSTAHVTYELQCPGLATPVFVGYSNLTGLNFATSNILKITAQAGGAGGGNNDITAHSWQVLYKPQPQ